MYINDNEVIENSITSYKKYIIVLLTSYFFSELFLDI